jgi:hypothetical protein
MLTFVELTHSCTDSIQPPCVCLKTKHYKYFPTKVYPDKQQNPTNPNLKNRKKKQRKRFLVQNLQRLRS